VTPFCRLSLSGGLHFYFLPVVGREWGVCEVVPGGHNVEVGVSAFKGDKAVVGDGESAAVAALLDITDGSLGASDTDKMERGDGDVAVAAAPLDADGPWGPSDMDEMEGGDGGAKGMEPLGDNYNKDFQFNDDDPQSDSCLQEMTAIEPDTLTGAPDKAWCSSSILMGT
jgi:hypothetical protein